MFQILFLVCFVRIMPIVVLVCLVVFVVAAFFYFMNGDIRYIIICQRSVAL